MLIIPAIDIRGGRCVRLVRGEASRELVYADDPVEVAIRWAAAGARWLHVVDLDGAFSGRPVHLEIVRSVVRSAGIPVQVGGGFRRLADVAAGVNAGAARVILGTAARSLAREAARRFVDRIAVAIDVKDGDVAVEGWTARLGQDAVTLAGDLVSAGIRRFIYTDATRDGTLRGPNVAAIRDFVSATPVPVIAAGGIGADDDLAALAGTGVEGVIVGRALYEGRVDLRAVAVRWNQAHAD